MNNLSMNNTVSKIVICAALIILALVSFFPLAKSFPDSKLYDDTVKECTVSIDEKTATVLRLTATATVTSAGLSAIPGDTATPIAEKLQEGSSITEKERLQLLYRVLWEVGFFQHGATILIVPSAESCEEFIDIKYELPSNFLFGDDANIEKHSGMPHEKELVTYADMIAKLTSVDGAVVLNKDLDLLGFGAEVLTEKMGSRHPKMKFIGYNDEEQTYKTFQDNGMRHRAGYRFCSAVDGSVAFVISQDGTVEACTKYDGKVVVYDNVALPMI